MARFDDPIARTTEWKPLKRGGSNFRTHTLVQRDGHRIALDKSVGFYLFGAAFLVTGLVCSGFGVSSGEWMLTLFGLPFAAVGLWIVIPRKILFDAETRQFTAGGKTTYFGTIHAIQIVAERVDGGDSADYTSYELNLVLKDGQRVHVIDHADLGSIRSNAQRLAGHIGCQVWDATP